MSEMHTESEWFKLVGLCPPDCEVHHDLAHLPDVHLDLDTFLTTPVDVYLVAHWMAGALR